MAVYPNPAMDGPVTADLYLPAPAEVSLTLVNLYGQVCRPAATCWRYRWTAFRPGCTASAWQRRRGRWS